MAGALDGLGYGRALGRFIHEDGATLPAADELARAIAAEPRHPLTAARADLLRAMIEQRWPPGGSPCRTGSSMRRFSPRPIGTAFR